MNNRKFNQQRPSNRPTANPIPVNQESDAPPEAHAAFQDYMAQKQAKEVKSFEQQMRVRASAGEFHKAFVSQFQPEMVGYDFGDQLKKKSRGKELRSRSN